MMNTTEKKQETKVRLSPRMNDRLLDGEGGYSGATLGRILRAMMEAENTVPLVLTKQKHGEYVRGLADAGVMFARDLQQMMVRADVVHVTTELVDKN
jgi:predicted aconitase